MRPEKMSLTRRRFLASSVMCALGARMSWGLGTGDNAHHAPNIVLILADDLGWGSLGCYGAPPEMLKTPNVDRLAREGCRFSDAVAPSSLCSPTRYGLLTGRYCWRTRLKHGVNGHDDPLLIEAGRPTIASILKARGYATACVGKWHLGFGNTPRGAYQSSLTPGPLDVGFDSYFGIPTNHGTSPFFVRDRTVEPWPNGQTPDVVIRSPSFAPEDRERFNLAVEPTLSRHTAQWLRERGAPNQPFFLYYAHVAPHRPLTPTAENCGSGAGIYGDWIQEMDASVGRLLKELDDLGLTENTIVIFASDNGGESPSLEQTAPAAQPFVQAKRAGLKINGDWRGAKHLVFEGGLRVPLIVRWPGKVQPGTTRDAAVCLVDLCATLAEAVGAPVPSPDSGAEDSFSFLPTLLDPSHKLSRPPIIEHSGEGTFAVRHGEWKWIEGKPAEKAKPRIGDTPEALYNLDEDPGERRNVLEEHPDIVQRLRACLDEARSRGRTR